MFYITLDLEWNQAYAQKALAVQRQLSSRLRGEVIQIGAVKLDKNLRICGSYQIIVKPRYFKKLHKHVSELTDITQEQMDVGTPLIIAAESFKKWCGEDFAFLTWGPDDTRIFSGRADPSRDHLSARPRRGADLRRRHSPARAGQFGQRAGPSPQIAGA